MEYAIRTSRVNVNTATGITLITERGYLLLVKSFTDPLA